MKRLVKGLFCSFVSISMMAQYCCPTFAQEDIVETTNEETESNEEQEEILAEEENEDISEETFEINNETENTCGDNLTWTLDDDGLLTISGNGDMDSFSGSGTVPWVSKTALIKNVVIDEGVTSISNYAFYSCFNITSISIPSSVESIGDYLIDNCTQLASITVSEANQVFDSRNDCNAIIKTSTNELLYGCKNTIIPNDVTRIGNKAFYGCQFTDITIPSSVESIGDDAFHGCSNLSSITIPDRVTSIGNNAFWYCTNLARVNLSNNVVNIGSSAFYGTAIDMIRIPDAITTIHQNTFANCTNLSSVVIPKSVTTINAGAFQNDTNLQKTYYFGTSEEWESITIGDNNEPLSNSIEYEYNERGYISLNKKTMYMDQGCESLIPTISYSTDTTITWTSSDESIATVDQNGNVTAISEGQATISVKTESGLTTSCEVYVVSPAFEYRSQPEDMIKNVGERAGLNIAFMYTQTFKFSEKSFQISTDKGESWRDLTSSDFLGGGGMRLPDQKDGVEIPTQMVETEGKIILVNEELDGNMYRYRVVDEDGNEYISNTATLRIAKPLEAISFENSEIVLDKEESQQLSVVLDPVDTTDDVEFEWTTSDESVATVDQKGNVTAISEGQATISVKTESGLTTSCEVYVVAPAFEFRSQPTDMVQSEGEYANLNISYMYTRTLKISKRIFEVSSDNGNSWSDLTGARGGGTQGLDTKDGKEIPTQIVASETRQILVKKELDGNLYRYRVVDQDGKEYLSDVAKLTVSNPITSISLNTEKIYIQTGKTDNLTVTINPEETTSDPTITWSSSDETIATVENGVVSALKAGKATITATSVNGKTATCEVITYEEPLLEGYSLSLDGSVGIHYYMDISIDMIQDGNIYMEFQLPNNQTQKVDTYTIQSVNGKEYYVFQCDVATKDMMGKITSQLYAGEEKIGSEYHYSVQEYVNYLVSNADVMGYSTKDVSIAKAMLTYGKYTQRYFYDTMDNITLNINDLEDVDLSEYAYTLTDANDDLDFVGARLVLTSKPGLKLYFKGEDSLENIEVQTMEDNLGMIGENLNTITGISKESVSFSQEGKYKVITISNISDMSKMYHISINGLELEYGMYSYGHLALSEKNVNLKNLIKAMVAYNNVLYS